MQMKKLIGFRAGMFLLGAVSAPGMTATNGLQLTIQTAWPIRMELSWPSNFTHAVDLYHCEDLRTAQWDFLVAGESTTGLEAIVVTDLDSTNHTAGFYIPGDAEQDSDLDVLADDRERYIYKTDPALADTDGDGMPDGWEVAYGFNPLLYADGGFDFDADGLSNADEYQHGTEPDVSDTDTDGMPDGWEVAGGLDPLTDDSADDPDGDGVSNLAEYIGGTHPQVANVTPPDGAQGSLVFRYDDDGRLTESHLNNTSSELYTLTPAHNVTNLNVFATAE
jgi:hypothetical protein